jgi:hypothetical protein
VTRSSDRRPAAGPAARLRRHPETSKADGGAGRWWSGLVPAVVAAGVVATGWALGWHGVDTAAQVFRVDSFRVNGFTLWDYNWYGGHWNLDYSVLYPTLAATFGILAVTMASAAVAAWAFDRLARSELGPAGAAVSYVFAVGTLVAASIGQLTFLAGEGFGLPALWAAHRGHHRLAALLALACTLTSPLTGAFLALAVAAWGVDALRRRDRGAVAKAAALAAVAALPILAAAVLFPGDGPEPYPVIDWLWEMVVAAGIGLAAGRRHRVVAYGCGLWMVAATFSVAVPSALGGNIGRLEDMVALPLGLALAWEQLPLLSPLVGVPLLLSQWGPAWGAFSAAPSAPSTTAAFFAPLDRELARLSAGGPAGRVEVVPTEYHWEADYVAREFPLARGWERQLDEADNPIFYQPGRLTPVAYRDWLLADGVRFVALPHAPLDPAGVGEARLVESGTVPGLLPVWASPQWRVYRVVGSPGIVSGVATLVDYSDGHIVLDASAAGTATVRIRWSPDWYVADGAGCVSPAGSSGAGQWLSVEVVRTGPVELDMSLFQPGRTACLTTYALPAPGAPPASSRH